MFSLIDAVAGRYCCLQKYKLVSSSGMSSGSTASSAVDTKLYIAMSPDDPGSIDALFNCILDIKSWMAKYFLQLNQDKIEVLFIGSEAQRQRINIRLDTVALNLTNPSKIPWSYFRFRPQF